MDQYKQIFVWKCLACGRVLTTPKGVERHQQKCRYIPVQMEGQMKFEEVREEREI